MKKLLAITLAVGVLGGVMLGGFVPSSRPSNCADVLVAELSTHMVVDGHASVQSKAIVMKKVRGTGAWDCLSEDNKLALEFQIGVSNDKDLAVVLRLTQPPYTSTKYLGTLRSGKDTYYVYRLTYTEDKKTFDNDWYITLDSKGKVQEISTAP